MIELLTIGFCILMLKSAIYSIICGAICVQLHERGFLMIFVASTIFAINAASELIPLTLLMLSPLLFILTIAFIWGIISPPIERRGYLGKQKQWSHELDADDPYLRTALILLSQERINEVASLSANAEDYRQNLVRAAGLEDHQIPDDF